MYDSFDKISSRLPLNERLRKVAEFVGRGDSWAVAARKAGFSETTMNVGVWRTDPRMQQLIDIERRKNVAAVDMTRKKVMEGFLEAIDQARIQADPATMIKGWTEVAKMCGYYAPETRKIEVSLSAKRVFEKYETMSDEALARLVDAEAIELTPDETGRYTSSADTDM